IGDTDKIVMYIAECKDMGIPVLPPDINESMIHFHSTGGKIRFGLLAIRNVGEGVIRSILQFREKKGRYRNLFHFCEEVESRSLNRRVLESLVKSGALDSLGLRRAQHMTMLDAALEHGQKFKRDRESGQKGLFADLSPEQGVSAEPVPADMPEWPMKQLLAHEKETIGFYVSGHPLDGFNEEVARFSRKSITELIAGGVNAECAVAGIVNDFQEKRTKKGELMGVFTLEDRTGAVETLVFPAAYQKCEPLMSSDFPILVSGRFEVKDEGSFKIIASDIEPLAGILERSARTLRISASIKNLSPESALNLHRLLEEHHGDTGVEIILYSPSNFRVCINSSDFVKVKSSPELIQRIEDICGPDSVRVLH
ncbi:MAG TPA: OB-fold nucleic acid binding domain-containing protein, partial [Acidobacteriota bacterium]|nr:OB-fold nucleic acid binding domain-containing protein [Acidobacteriota bacterium]